MQIIRGTIQKIEEHQIGVHEKAIVDVKGIGRERAFIEFKGKNMMETLKPFKDGSKVEIVASLEASISNAGVRFNNLIAYKIQPVEL